MAFHVIAGATETLDYPVIRKITLGDTITALRRGIDDFWDKPSHYVLLTLIYPIVGIALAVWSSGNYTWPLLYPLMGGFALIGPFAAIGLYEISRRRELGLDTSWSHAFEVLRSPALPSIFAIAVLLLFIFTLWLATAQTLYESLFGSVPPQTFGELYNQVFNTPQGWTLFWAGNALGLVFALVTLATTVIAFPLMLDRDCGAFVAVQTSFRAVVKNPIPMLAWGLIVAIGVALGSLPVFAGLAVVIPVFGHATWHLYRQVVAPAR